MFERLTADTDATAPAEIEVERIDGPVLLISGSDDQLWPSSVFAERVLRRRGDTDHADRHLKLTDAGHFVSAPYALPTLPPMTQLSPPGPISIDFGGTAEANARAAWKTWHETLAFLEHLRDA